MTCKDIVPYIMLFQYQKSATQCKKPLFELCHNE